MHFYGICKWFCFREYLLNVRLWLATPVGKKLVNVNQKWYKKKILFWFSIFLNGIQCWYAKIPHLNCISDVMKLFSAYHETIGSKVGIGTFWEIRNVLVLKFENTSKTELCLNLASNNWLMEIFYSNHGIWKNQSETTIFC